MQKMTEKSEKIMIFMYFYGISQYVCGRKVKLCRYFTWKKTGKITLKKHVKSGKSRNFQKVLKSSIRLQITF